MYSSYEKKRQEKQLISDDIQAEKEKKEHTQNLLNKIDEQRNKDLPISPAQMGSSKIDNESVIFGYNVKDPQRYGVVEFDENCVLWHISMLDRSHHE